MGIEIKINDKIREHFPYLKSCHSLDSEVISIGEKINNYDHRLSLLWDEQINRFVVVFVDINKTFYPWNILIWENPDHSFRPLSENILDVLKSMDNRNGHKLSYDEQMKIFEERDRASKEQYDEIVVAQLEDVYRMRALEGEIHAPIIGMHRGKNQKKQHGIILPGDNH